MTTINATVKTSIGFAADRRARRCAPLFMGVLLLALAACNGTAVVTLTSTPSTDTFLAYRVNLVSVQLQTSSGKTTAGALPSSTTVDLARLTNLADVVGTVGIASGNFSQVAVTLDYSSAQIVYDDGTPDGVPLTPIGPSGQAVHQVTMTLYLDPSNQLSILRKGSGRLSLEFNLAASNVVNLTQKTVTVTPLMAASAAAIDSKVVRVRGVLGGVSTSNTDFSSGIQPFDFATAGSGSLEILPSNVTTYEIDGKPSTGTAGLADLAALKPGVDGRVLRHIDHVHERRDRARRHDDHRHHRDLLGRHHAPVGERRTRVYGRRGTRRREHHRHHRDLLGRHHAGDGERRDGVRGRRGARRHEQQ